MILMMIKFPTICMTLILTFVSLISSQIQSYVFCCKTNLPRGDVVASGSFDEMVTRNLNYNLIEVLNWIGISHCGFFCRLNCGIFARCVLLLRHSWTMMNNYAAFLSLHKELPIISPTPPRIDYTPTNELRHCICNVVVQSNFKSTTCNIH